MSYERRESFVENCTSFPAVLLINSKAVSPDSLQNTHRTGHWTVRKEVAIKFQTYLQPPGANSPRFFYDQRQDFYPEEEERRFLRNPVTFLPIYMLNFTREEENFLQ